MSTIHISKPDPTILRIVAAAFPDYRGRKYKLEPLKEGGTINVRSYWDGGSRYAFVRLDTFQAVEVPAQSPFDPELRGAEAVTLPPNVVCVRHAIFCGKDCGVTIIAPAAQVAPLLPPVAELTREERIVLVATRGLKSSYAGVSNYRYVEANRDTGIGAEAWETAKRSCIAKGLLNAAGAITAEGRNAAGTGDLWQFRTVTP